MTSTRKTSKYKAYAAAIAACLAFILCPLFSLFNNIDNTVSSADGTVGSDVGVRFVQIAAGEDFAIGLTYDSKLYGWSLLGAGENGKELSGNNAATTLGEYYTSTPTLIDYKLLVGPGSNGVIDWSTGSGTTTGYHALKQRSEDAYTIKQIVATRYTAAFVTNDGYIYTWGVDGGENSPSDKRDITYVSDGNTPHNLLLRALGDNVGNSLYPSVWYMPYIIDYGYYSDGTSNGNDALKLLIPGSGSLTNVSIAAGEYNYIVSFTKNTYTYTYSWGSLMYIATNYNQFDLSSEYNLTSGQNTDVNGGAPQQRYAFRLAEADQAVTVVAGGYTLGINSTTASPNETSLLLKGKNFLTSAGVTAGAIANTTLISEIEKTPGGSTGESAVKFNEVTYEKAIAGGRLAQNDKDNKYIITPSGSAKLFYGAQYSDKSGGLSFYSVNSANTAIYDSRNVLLNTVKVQNDGGTVDWKATTVMRFSAALGNDIGYGYDSNGNLYAWGDDSLDQLPGLSGAKNVPTDTNIDDVVSIAAGKQLTGELSNSPKPFNSVDYTFADKNTKTAFHNDAQNEKEYISAVLLKNGTIKAWGYNNNAATAASDIYFADVSTATVSNSTKNYFVAVYSGYGNNLFAVNAQGQAVRITQADGTFKQEVYDTFCDTRKGTPVRNWSVAASGANKLVFRVDENELKNDPEPALGTAILYVDSVNASRNTIQLNRNDPDDNNALFYSGSDRKSLVTANNSGNAYRILSPSTYNKTKFITEKLTKADPAAATALPDDVNVKFYYKNSAMDNREEMGKEQLDNMFGDEKGAEFVYYKDGDYSGVGIRISPVQSTKGGTVTVEFYVARYDNAANFVVTNDGAAGAPSITNSFEDNAVYYDVQKCSVDIEVDNTPAHVVYQPFYGDVPQGGVFADGKCKVPLLDPNNAALKYFSIPVYDVNTGIDVLATYVSSLGGGSAKNVILNSITDAIKFNSTNNTGDRGFPESKKVADGNLTYYLNSVDVALFADKYSSYLIEDRDADITQLRGISYAGEGVDATAQSVKISIVLPGDGSWTPTDDDVSKLNQKMYKEFNNLYGFTDLAISYDSVSSAYKLDFTYEVLRFEAKGSTGLLQYTAEADGTYKVNSYNTINDDDNSRFVNVRVSLREYPTYGADYKTIVSPANVLPDVPVSNVATAFSQPSLRFTRNNTLYYGDSADTDHNRMSINYTDGNEVMAGCAPITINLASYFGFEPGSNIRYSFDGCTTKYGDFIKQFRDETNSGTEIVTLSGTEITVRPTTTKPINFTVVIQRFHGVGPSFEKENGFGKDEQITVSFSFSTIQPFAFSWTGMNTSIPVTGGGGTIDVLGGDATLNKTRLVQTTSGDYDKLIMMSGLSSSNPSVLSVPGFEGSVARTSFTVTPHASGTAVVQFVLTILNKSVVCSLNFNVSAVTALNDSINLIDTSYIYVNSIVTELKRANSFRNDISGFGIIYDDTAADDSVPADEVDLPRAVYFTRKDNGKRERPKFVKGVSFVDAETTNPRMRVELDDQENDLAGEYVMHLRFINKDRGYKTYQEAIAAGADVLETTESIRSSKKIVLDKETNSIYTVAINVDSPKEAPEGGTKADWYTTGSNVDMKVMIPVRYLLVGIVDNPDEYNIFLVSAASNAPSYFNYSFNTSNEVVITPLYNTLVNEDGVREAINVNVSVAPSNPTSTTGNQILSFRISVDGISETLSLEEYRTIWIVAFFSSLGLLIIIFVIRLIVYWRRRAKQRALIKRNQELIRMRDRIHNKSTQATREQIVRSRMKMQDPKYAKMVSDMRKERDGTSGVTVDSGMGVSVSEPGKKGKKKKKGGKKSIAELKAELEAKKAAFAQAQSGAAQPIDVPLDSQGFGQGGYGMPDQGFVAPDQGFAEPGGFGSPTDAFSAQDLDANAIIFDSPDDGMQQG